MKNIALLTVAVLAITGCRVTVEKEIPLKEIIVVPNTLKRGQCERPIPALKGNTGRDLYNFADNALGKIEQCQSEKRQLIKIIEENNNKW